MFSLSHVLQTAETLLHYRSDEFLCDTILIAKDCQLKAHSVVLAAVSPVFKAAFCTGSFPSGTFQVDLPDVDSDVLQMALDFIYTGELLLPSPAYASATQLSTLFSTLQDLGVDIEKLNGSEMKFKSELKQTQTVAAVKGSTKRQNKSMLDETEAESFSTDLDLSALSGADGDAEAACKKAEDDWSWSDEMHQLSGDKASASAVAVAVTDDDDLTSITANDKMDEDLSPHIGKDEGAMYIEMTGSEDDQKFVIVSHGDRDGDDGAADDTEEESDGSSGLTCKTCDRQFTQRQSLIEHEKQHACGTSRSHSQHVCNMCGELFERRPALDKHMAVKHVNPAASTLVKCSTCHKEYPSLFEFNLHMVESPGCAAGDIPSRMIYMARSRAEVNYRPFLCDICGKNFSTALSLRMHHKLHTGERPFACSTCGKSFVQKIQLTQHELRHLGIRPFGCSVCDRTFSQKAQLTQHMRLHTGDRPFVCECGADFLSKAMLSQHRRTHTGDRPHVCATCGKAFAYKESLVVHIRTHTGEKPFECTICGSRYTQSHHLKGHLRTHTGEKPFACQLCAKTYKNRVDLRFHCTRVHNIDITKRHAKPPIMTLNP